MIEAKRMNIHEPNIYFGNSIDKSAFVSIFDFLNQTLEPRVIQHDLSAIWKERVAKKIGNIRLLLLP